MGKVIRTLIVLFYSVGCMAQSVNPYFYYFQGEKQLLELDTDCVNVLKKNSQSRSGEATWAEIQLREINVPDYSEKISFLKTIPEVSRVIPCFKTNTGDKMGLSDYFYVKLNSLSDTTLLRQYSNKKGALVVRQNKFMPLWFILSCKSGSRLNAMEYANMYYESGLFSQAEPDFTGGEATGYTSSITDTYFPNQWAIRNTGQYNGTAGIDINVTPVWDMGVLGANTVVAVIDIGIQLNHPDLRQNIYPLSYDSGSDSSPSQIKNSAFHDEKRHGTCCAGIIGAAKNNVGIVGVAPQCKLMSISNTIPSSPLRTEKMANAICWAATHGADIISNSWIIPSESNILDNAIDYATSVGRNGLGCIVVASSGNIDAPLVRYPASNDKVIGVGAITPTGKRKENDDSPAWGSAYGTGLDIVAPGLYIQTIDLIENNYNGYCIFGGTSSACPYVAGVASLILSENPLLTSERVKQILMHTATKLPSYTYVNKASRIVNPGNDPNPYELDNLSFTWNNETGSGLINAYQAVLLAQEDKPFIYGGPRTYRLANLPKDRDILVRWTTSSSYYYISSYSGDQSLVTLDIMGGSSAPASAVLTAKIYILTESPETGNTSENYVCTVRRTITRTSSYYISSYRIAQNPVNTTLRLLKDANEEILETMQTRKAASDVTVNLYSNMTRVVSQKFSASDNEIILDTSSLPTGNYVLNVLSNGQIVLSQTIFIKH